MSCFYGKMHKIDHISRFRHFENLKTPIILINTGIAGVFFGKKCCM